MFIESFSMLLSYLIFSLFFFLCLFHFFYFLFGRCRVQYFMKDQESQWPRKDLNYEPVIRSRWMHCTASHGHWNVWLLKKNSSMTPSKFQTYHDFELSQFYILQEWLAQNLFVTPYSTILCCFNCLGC